MSQLALDIVEPAHVYVCRHCSRGHSYRLMLRADGDYCIDCYQNPTCPDLCNYGHDAPVPDENGQWECPTTGTLYDRCDACDAWNEHTRWSNDPARIDGEWYCEPSEHEWTTCNDCDAWVHYDDEFCCEDCEVSSCQRCYGRYHDHEDEPEYDDDGDRPGATHTPTCDRCHEARALVAYDVDTEEALCDPCVVLFTTQCSPGGMIERIAA